MTDDLKDSLRAAAWPGTDNLYARAADRIEALEAQLKATIEREADTQRRHDTRIEALEARVAMVKPLEWELVSRTQTWQAKTILGEYAVGFDDGWWAQLEGATCWNWDSPENPRVYLGPEAAQLACKADYAARILSVVDLVPADTIRAEAVAGSYAVAAARISPFGPRPDDDPADAAAWDVLQEAHDWLLEMTPADAQAALDRRDAEVRKKLRKELHDAWVVRDLTSEDFEEPKA